MLAFTPEPATTGGWKTRLGIVLLAALAPLLVWLVARIGFGLDVRSPTYDGQHFEIGPIQVLITALVPALLGWGLLALLEGVTVHARLVWILVALTGLILSLSGPLSGTSISTGGRMTLILMHLAVGVVLIPGLASTVRRRL
jgi:hypothetical protein